jgi:hypothetical protein
MASHRKELTLEGKWMGSDLNVAVAEFVGAFELVFRHDWEYTKIMIGDEMDGGTFVEPGLADESEDWAARGALLKKYRALVAVMQSAGIVPKFPFPLENLPRFSGRNLGGEVPP